QNTDLTGWARAGPTGYRALQTKGARGNMRVRSIPQVMKPSVPVVVFTDVDDSLLTPSTNRAIDPHETLGRENITLVLCSSKTCAELEIVQQELGIRHPFICESGAAVFVPHGYFPFEVPRDRDGAGYHVIEFGMPYVHVVDVLHRTASHLGV